jgi:phage virion morphogenesis protein
MPEMIKVTDNFAEGAKVLDQIARKASNTVGLMRQMTGIMLDEVEENFSAEGRPNKWKPLAASTIRRRRAKGNWPGKILQVRGRLAASIQGKYDNNIAVVGTNVKYAAIQHFGGTTKHAARERVLHFDQRTAGKMTHGRPGKNVDHFAKPGKASYAMKVMGKGHQATIPARPFLYLGQKGVQRMIDSAKAWLSNYRGL